MVDALMMRGSYPSDNYYWIHIGLRKTNGTWKYMNGANPRNITWMSGHPAKDDDVAMFLSYDGYPDDLLTSSCTRPDNCQCYAICEYKC